MKEQETLNEDYFDENQYEIDNRIRNLYWTVSGNYGENIKLDTVSFSRSPWVSLYDAVKQGAFSRYFDRNAFGLYLVKKLYYGADEQALTNVAQLAVDSAVYRKISAERKGVQEIRKKAFSDLLEYDFTRLASYYLGQIKICMMQQAVRGSVSHEQARMRQVLDLLAELEDTYDTMEIIRVTDKLYNWLVDPYFEKNHGDLAKVLAVTMEELKEFSWKDYLEEEAKEEELTQVLNQVNQAVTQTGEASTEQEQKRINRSLCRGAHADCSLYFTDGILSNMVKRNYQSEYARRSKSENLRVYGHHSRVAKRNIEILTDTLRRALVARSERETVRSEYGNILPKQLWKLGRSRDKKLFERVLKKDSSEFVVHVLIDASGSQRSRQSLVALQGYIISEALSNVQIPHRVMGFCTFWDYTVMQRYRDYDDPKEANKRIFEFHASSNNRDGLAIRAAAASLQDRPEENKVLIVLSDGRPNDIIVNRPNSKNPMPYAGDYAVRDTSFEVRKVRAEGISVLGVFAGEEQDLQAERRIFGKDFAYIRNIMNFSSVVGLYLKRQLDDTAQ